MVGLVRTAATFGSSNSSRILARRRAHCSRSPACWASSNTAFAYRLAAAVATRDLLNSPVDELFVLAIVERFADHLFRSHDHQSGQFVTRRLKRTLAFNLDLFPSRLGDPSRLLLGLLLGVLPRLLGGSVGSIDDLLRGLARVLQFSLGFLETRLRVRLRMLRPALLPGERWCSVRRDLSRLV